MTQRGRYPYGWGVYGRPRPLPPWMLGGGRHVHRSSLWLLASGLVTILATLMAWGLLAIVVVMGLAREPSFMALLVASVFVVGQRRGRRRARRLAAAGTAPLPRHPAPPPRPPRPEFVWSRARARFTDLRAAYAAHECDPMAVLRLPALSDVTVPATARFVDAFAEAQALETDAFPPQSHATAFVAAVERAERAWQAARDAAERIRLSNLTPAERNAVERVIKLLTTARDSDSDAERLAAYSRARAELAKLDRAGVIHMPRTALAVLEVAGRRQLPA
jgi:hypothetical protein